MSALTPLEQALLQEICRRHPDGAGLQAQIKTATVLRRENSGAGFFVHLHVDRSAAQPIAGARVSAQVAVSIEGLSGPLLAMLFLEEGYAALLEGAATDGSTQQIDFATCRFSLS